jgi:hypothetical protein
MRVWLALMCTPLLPRAPKRGTQMKHLALVLIALLAPFVPAWAVTGAAIQAATCDDNAATIAVANQSRQDITGFTVTIRTVLAGRQVHWEHTEDYGPLLTAKGKALHPQESMTFTKPLDPTQPCTQVEAKVTVVIYQDGTAEADRGAGVQSLNHTIAVRQHIAKTLQVTADILEASLQQPKPEVNARAQLQKLLQKSKDADDSGDYDMGYLGGALDLVDKSTLAPDQQQFLEDNIQRLRTEAIAFSAYAQVRRAQ